jgi:S-adenosylmethionine:tRNA ribosyltransferase-isomerase
MISASWPRDDPGATRLLEIDPVHNRLIDRRIGELSALLRKGDLLVVNDAATLPASLRGVTEEGVPVELRLAGERPDQSWNAVLFGAGDWRTRTEDRLPPPRVKPGSVIRFDGLRARILGVDGTSPRLVSVAFDPNGEAFWSALYRAGRPVQYAHTARPLALWHVQTGYAARPWASEAPSAGFGLTWDLLLGLRQRGVELARLTHAAGLSATGDAGLDARLPLPERYEIPAETVEAVTRTHVGEGRVVAVGTTVTRALEGAAANGGGRLLPGRGTTDLHLGPDTRRRVVDGILTGAHDAGSSHFRLLEAFAPPGLLARAHDLAEASGYRSHEFGDAMVVLSPIRRGRLTLRQTSQPRRLPPLKTELQSPDEFSDTSSVPLVCSFHP